MYIDKNTVSKREWPKRPPFISRQNCSKQEGERERVRARQQGLDLERKRETERESNGGGGRERESKSESHEQEQEQEQEQEEQTAKAIEVRGGGGGHSKTTVTNYVVFFLTYTCLRQLNVLLLVFLITNNLAIKRPRTKSAAARYWHESSSTNEILSRMRKLSFEL